MSGLHPDFPISEAKDRWDHPAPIYDIANALDAQYGTPEPIQFDNIASVTDYFIEGNNGRWTPETPVDPGTELTIALVGTLRDGRWFALEGWNDYTGWGCQDKADVYIGSTKDDVVANGLTVEGRNHLGLVTA